MGRVGGIAVIDVAATIIAAYLLSRYEEWNFVPTACGLFILGEVTHVLLGIQTPVTKYIVG